MTGGEKCGSRIGGNIVKNVKNEKENKERRRNNIVEKEEEKRRG